jgi:glycine/D-amino acid oxidase-like deaminating enzyme
VFDLIARYQIPCSPVRAGWLQLAHSASALRAVTTRAQQWQALGAPVEVLNAAEAARLSGTQAYVGGMLDRRGGTLHPLAYAHGLAKAAASRGARIFANTAVQRLGRTHYGWFVETEHGNVAARKVILATNAYTDAQFDEVRRSYVALPSFQIASEPLPPSLRATILPGGQAVSDTKRLLRYFRLDPQGRLIMGGRGAFGVRPTATAITRQIDAVRQIFPAAADLDFPYAWGGLVAMTPNHMPLLHEPAANLLACVGYNGRGIAMATVLGRILAGWASGLPWQDIGYPVTKIRPMALHEYSELAARLAIQYYRLRDAIS